MPHRRSSSWSSSGIQSQQRSSSSNSNNSSSKARSKSLVAVLLLFAILVLAPLVFVAMRAGNFSVKNMDFSDESSSNNGEGRKLTAIGELDSFFPAEVLSLILENSAVSMPSHPEEHAKDKTPTDTIKEEEVHSIQESSPIQSNSSESQEPVLETRGLRLLSLHYNQHAEGRIRLRRDKERISELTKRDQRTNAKLENEAIERSRAVPRATIGRQSLWRQPSNEVSDNAVRLMREQLIMAKIYVSIAHVRDNGRLLRDLKLRIREVTSCLGDANIDSELPRSHLEKIALMGQTLARARQEHFDCGFIVRKLRAMLVASEEYARGLKKDNSFLSQLAAKTIPKALYCFSLRLNVEYYNLAPEARQFPATQNLQDKSLHHYCLFSDNILAASVVVDSLIKHAKEPQKHVIHLVTDRLNYGAMRMWFLANPPGKASIEVQNIDEFKWLNSSYCPVLRQLETAAMKDYYFKPDTSNSLAAGSSNLKYRNPKYLSMLNHLRFYLPQIYPGLDKILFLDDDIVVQKDLTPLWDVDLKGNVNGAVETCGRSFHRFDTYLNFSNPHIARNFKPDDCGWAYGMNMFDLNEWKKRDITGIYHRWQTMNEDRTLWKLGSLPPGLITFYNLTFPLDKSWHVLGLGYNNNIDRDEIERAGVVHYNGNLKPWLDIGFNKYKSIWTKHVRYEHPYLQQCNINR